MPRCPEEGGSTPEIRIDPALLSQVPIEISGLSIAPRAKERIEVVVQDLAALPSGACPLLDQLEDDSIQALSGFSRPPADDRLHGRGNTTNRDGFEKSLLLHVCIISRIILKRDAMLIGDRPRASGP
jgi:hypothetical protein